MAIGSTFKTAIRSAIALLLAGNLFVAGAQTPDDSRDAKIAAAMKVFTEASELGNRSDRESKIAAIKKLETIEKVFEELGDREKLAGTLSVHGTLLFTTGRPEPGLEVVNRALTLYKSLNKAAGQAIVLAAIGGIYSKQGDNVRARDVLEEARMLIEKEPFQSFDLQILNALGNVYIALNDRAKATDALWKAVEIAKTRDSVDAVTALKNYADAQVTLGTPKYSLFYYESALRRARSAKLTGHEATLLNSIGGLHLNVLEETANAKEYLDQALAKLESVNDESLKCLVLYNLGYYNYRSIRMQDALDYYEKAKVIAQKINNRSYEANISNNTGLVYAFLNDYRRAIPYFEQAVAFAREIGDKQTEMHVLSHLAKSQVVVGDNASALANYVTALAIANELAKKKGFLRVRNFAVNLLVDFGNFFVQAGQREQAMELFSKALEKAREWGQRHSETVLLNNTAKIHQLNGDDAKALEIYNSSLALSRSLGNKYGEAKTLENLMGVWSKLGNRNFAAFYGKNAVNIYQEFRKGIQGLGVDEQKSFLKTVESTYRDLASVLIAQGRIAEAEQVLVMLKEEELIDYVRRDDSVAKEMLATMSLSEDERAALTRYGTLAEKITAVGKEFGELDADRKAYPAGEFPKQKLYDELKQQLADATVVFEKFLEELKLKFGQKDSRVVQVDSGLKKTLERLKAKRTAIVSTIVGEDILNIIVTTSKTQRAHTIKKSAKEINELVANFRAVLTSPDHDPRPASQALYDLLIKPIEGDLAGIRADTIVWSMDGTLRYVPPAALWDKEKGYLAERFANVIINLASRDTLALPVANSDNLTVLGVGVSQAAEGFAALTAVPDELSCIVADSQTASVTTGGQCKSGVLKGRKLLDDAFTLTSFENEIGRYPIIHIASHFQLRPGDDKNSFLLLGGGTQRKFTVEQLRNQSLTDVELIVLSACNTATPGGAKTNGVEIEGFGSIAQEEGAKAVMATLWSVADTSTKDLMVEFYRKYGNGGSNKAEALRSAQIKLMNGKYTGGAAARKRDTETFSLSPGASKDRPPFEKDPNAPFAHPYYWSPFVLIGNWR